MKLPVYLLVMMMLLFKVALVSSQTCDSLHAADCAAKDLSPLGIMLGHIHPKGVWKISYRYMNTRMNGNLSGTKKVDDDFVLNNYAMSSQKMSMNMHMLMAMYGITDRFSMMAMSSYNLSSMTMSDTMQMQGSLMDMSGHHSNPVSSTTSGFGDIKLYVVYSLIHRNMQHLWINGGVNFPVGNIKMKGAMGDPMYPLQRFPYSMQTGSGSFDFMPGITYLVSANKSAVSAQISSVIRPFNNALHYHLGNEFTFNVWGAYQWLPWVSSSLRLEGSSVGSISGCDTSLMESMEPNANSMNYGGQYSKSYFGLNFYLNKGWLKNNKLFVEYGMPIYQNVNGIQLQHMSSIYAGWMISF